ncbi:MAG: NPXTG-anchored protein [Ruminococcus sp.]|nr:NPXTG-anchored protein [Ruminococcus sp.]
MKISKIFAGMSAFAVACTMCLAASAKEYKTDGALPEDWGVPKFPEFGEGDAQQYIPLSEFEEYKDTGCTVKINIAELDPSYDYWLIGAGNANGWKKLYAEGLPADDKTALDSAYVKDIIYKDNDVDEEYYFVQQKDGFIVLREGCTEAFFTLTPEGVQYLFDNAGTAEDTGETWGGMVFQDYGVVVSSVELGVELPEAKKIGEEDAGGDADTGDADTGDADTGDTDTGDADTDDGDTDAGTTDAGTTDAGTTDGGTSGGSTTTTTTTTTGGTANTSTGASAGLALAGLALAGAAVVASKKR